MKQKGFLFFLLILFVSPGAWAATYYVSGGQGNDANPGTVASPWKTINKANATLQSGDIVFLRGGTYYGDYINPARSGTSDTSRITYRNYPNEIVTVRDASYGVRINGKSYITVSGIRFYNLDHFLYIENNANYNKIEDCAFDLMRTYTWGGSRIWNSSKYNQIRHSSFSRWGTLSSGDNGTILDIGNWSVSNDFSDYNLIESNTFYAGGHHLVGIASQFNVIRNNYLHHEPWTSCSRGQCGNRNLITEGYRAKFNLYEGNTIAFASWPPDDNGASGITISSPQNIVRLNKFHNNEAGGVEISNQTPFENANANHIYNNVFYHNGYNLNIPSAYRVGLYFANWGGSTVGNAIKNNIFYNNQSGAIKYGSSSSSLQYVEGNWMEGGNPQFVDISSPSDPQNPDLHDFRLQSSSPVIDGGVFLTSTTSGGTGYTIPLEDPYYFMDGWGVIGGDMIQLEGQTKAAQIISMNYDLKTITVGTSLTWTRGQGISLKYAGNRPDMGSYEYGESATPPPPEEPPVGNDLTIRMETGVFSAPMRLVAAPELSSGYYIETTTASAGQVVFNFQIASSGSYQMIGDVFAANAGADSFFVKLDGGVEDAWDLNPTSDPAQFNVWRQDAVTARGNGSVSQPQFDPLVVQLEAGAHSLTISGREANAKLALLKLIPVSAVEPTPTPTASPTPTPTPTASPTPTPTSTPKTRGKGVGRSK